ncbi:hypothetical protein ACFPK1_27675 [Actinomycetospora rhizophila]|uniref:Uncharacterized protein n=1 Tax=Actinomycetospora rhizophila TaxID=1416876 RepID=A0ABV9ZNJ2_9PSEU
MSGSRAAGETVSRARLFVVSYSALALMFAARFVSQEALVTAAVFAAIGAWGLVDGYRLVRGAKRRSKHWVEVENVSDAGQAVSGYLATYLLPFLGNLPGNGGDWVAVGLYFVVALMVYVKTDLALINPTLYLYGYRLAKASLDGQDAIVVSRHRIRSGDSVLVSNFLDVIVVTDMYEGEPN